MKTTRNIHQVEPEPLLERSAGTAQGEQDRKGYPMIAEATTSPFLTDDEIDEICEPLKIGAAKCKHLRRMGLVVKTKPNGRPLVARVEFERVMTGRTTHQLDDPKSSGPNVVGLKDFFQKRKYGTRT